MQKLLGFFTRKRSHHVPSCKVAVEQPTEKRFKVRIQRRQPEPPAPANFGLSQRSPAAENTASTSQLPQALAVPQTPRPQDHQYTRDLSPPTPLPHPCEDDTPAKASASGTVPPLSAAAMAEAELKGLLQQLHSSLSSGNYDATSSLLSRAKIALLHLDALIPSPTTSQPHLLAARETLELGALASIRRKDPESFTRYFQQLQPFYTLPESRLQRERGNASKVTGLYLLLLLSQGDYAGFHTLLEALAAEAQIRGGGGGGLEDDAFIQYPIRLEQALMEGSYDRVWGETKSESVPSEEFGIFSEVLIGTIRLEIASCSEKAYPSVPVADAKSLLFLDSEGAVVDFARARGWVARDGRIYFPQHRDGTEGIRASEADILAASGTIIENTLGYARELETIV